MTPALTADPGKEFGPPVGLWRNPDFVAWALLASLTLHLVAGLAIVWQRQMAAPPLEQSVPVELLTPEQYEARTSPAPSPGVGSAPALGGVRIPSLGMIRPTQMLSAAALADPKSRQAREMLPSFEGTERMVQLCNLEAMEQVHAWQPDLKPERISAYAMADLSIVGETIKADGAAFRSDRRWYNLRFACVLSPDHARVVDFQFRVGDPVPQSQLATHNLPLTE